MIKGGANKKKLEKAKWNKLTSGPRHVIEWTAFGGKNWTCLGSRLNFVAGSLQDVPSSKI